MTMKNETLIIESLKTLSRDVREIRATVPKIAKIEEHLDNLNGTIKKHEDGIGDLDTKCVEQDKRIDKIYIIGGVILTIGGSVIGLVFWLIARFK